MRAEGMKAMRQRGIKGQDRGGFSLVEILIAVLILALGLLGLGVVFPVVIREQRIAQERIGGSIADNNIRALLQGDSGLGVGVEPIEYIPNSYTNPNSVTVVATYTGWQYLAEPWTYYTWVSDWRRSIQSAGGAANVPPPNGPVFEFSNDGLWETDWDWNGSSVTLNDYQDTGRIMLSPDLGAQASAQQAADGMPVLAAYNAAIRYPSATTINFERRIGGAVIPLASRLNPAGVPNADTPTYVWDIAARRLNPAAEIRRRFLGSTTTGQSLEMKAEKFREEAGALQVAVFVRRVDPQIRPSVGANGVRRTLRESFLNPGLAAADRRLPVGEEPGNGSTGGPPTLDGTDGNRNVRYSLVRDVDAAFNVPAGSAGVRREWIDLPGIQDDNWAFIRQVGQRVVDNVGNVYTVVGSEVNGGLRQIRVDPPVPTTMTATSDADNTPTSPTYTVQAVRQLIFTPQIPVSVFVTEVKP